MNTIADAKAVASLQGKPILEDIEELLQHQIVKQEREFNEKYRLERKKMREKAWFFEKSVLQCFYKAFPSSFGFVRVSFFTTFRFGRRFVAIGGDFRGDVVQLEEQRTVIPYVASSILAISATQGYRQAVKATPFDGVTQVFKSLCPCQTLW